MSALEGTSRYRSKLIRRMKDVASIIIRIRELTALHNIDECAMFMVCAKCHLILQLFQDVASIISENFDDTTLEMLTSVYLHIGRAPNHQVEECIDHFLSDVEEVCHKVQSVYQLPIPA